MDTLSLLKKVPVFRGLPEVDLKWLEEKGELQPLGKNVMLFGAGDTLDFMLIVLEGALLLKKEEQAMGRYDTFDIAGLLPYQEPVPAAFDAESMEESSVLILDRSHFSEMIHEHEALTTALVRLLISANNQQSEKSQQDDRMITLGKQFAGLVHDLNNPSAAVFRSAKELSGHLKFTPEKFGAMLKIDLNDDEINKLTWMMSKKMEKGVHEMGALDRNAYEDEMIAWLEENEIADPEDFIDNFIDYGFTIEDLDFLADLSALTDLHAVYAVVNQAFSTHRLMGEIEDGSQRIGNLVHAIKSITHSTSSTTKEPADIHDGIRSTLMLFKHKLRDKGVEVSKDFDESIPKPQIIASTMNQVWTNLIDNAIDAMEGQEKGVLSIATEQDGDFVCVEVADTGSGIPKDVIDKVFDPFFTTKGVGKGTGLGLDNVRKIIEDQHQGEILVDSTEGGTVFTIRIPVKAA